MKVSAQPLARALGSGWRAEPADTLGEAMIRLWLRALGVTDADVQEAAGGWGGDRLVAATGPGGATAVAWDLVWDTPADAAQFTQLYGVAARHLASVTGRLVAISDRETLVVQGSSAAIVDRTVAGLS